MTLSDTEVGGMWLENFPHEDRQLARKLLDAFALDSWTSARALLLDLLRAEISSAQKTGTVWVIPAMDTGDIRRANHLDQSARLIAFGNFEPGMDIPSMPGSEGLIGHLLRDVQGKDVLSSTTQLSVLRNKHVRTIIVVTDTIETGAQVAKYVQAILRNPTLRSWRSFHWIKLKVVAYAVSREGEEALSHSRNVDSLRFVRRAPTIRSLPWTAADIADAISFCRRYGRGSALLGYGEQASLFGFQDRVPNTVPRVFRQTGADWASLFEGKNGRLVPTGMIGELLDSSEGPVAHDDVVAAVRQERLSISIHKQQRESNRDILAALALLRASPERATLLGLALDLTQTEVSALLDYLVSQGWISESHSLTQTGIAELTAGKRKLRRVEHRPSPMNLQPYYPESLR
ncbi:hypothetical protein JOE40_004156 [Arthrobacter sp. PvP102]|uniref:phosphoribosyltransferase-like protein n=1 Tax=unclassified Arthrobacter TaxID=235627 RepID=UPI001AE4C3A1|nr:MULTISPECIES: hypothetical protein [unclassified Arthrobacter]MBP1234513.1 hypothetical protein [Arthrobacter sp. PvP103]MBP1239647.1 hypothetical protein [Arthrobacter sp. PvP102]